MSTHVEMPSARTVNREDSAASEMKEASVFTLLRGVIALAFGAVCFFAPQYALTFFIALFGAYAFLDGALALISAIQMARQRQPWLGLLFLGIVGIGAGIATYRAPFMTAAALFYIIAAWAIVTGILEIVGSFAVADVFVGAWAVAAAGGLSILLGYLLLAWPGLGIVSLVYAIGLYALLYGIIVIYAGWQMRDVARSV